MRFFNFENKFGWAEAIALGALIISGCAMHHSRVALDNATIINRLNFRPKLSLQTRFQSSNNIPAYIAIKNTGPVDAIQLQIQFHFLRYFSKTNMINASATGSDLQWTIDKLPPLKSKIITLDDIFLQNLLPVVTDSEKHHRILEIRLIYRRDAGLKEYTESAFYFTNQNGNFVAEDNSSLDPAIYNPIKKAAFKRFNIDTASLNLSSDILHDLSN